MSLSLTHSLPERSKAEWSRDTGAQSMTAAGPLDLYRWLKLFARFLQMARELEPAGRALLWQERSRGFRCQMLDATLLVGRAKDCDIVLADPAVSRRHFRIVAEAATVRLSDCDSTHGTWVNRRKVRETILRAPALIQAGASAVLFIDGSQMAEQWGWRRAR